MAYSGSGPVYKILDIVTLALYWNSRGDPEEWYGSRSGVEIKQLLQDELEERLSEASEGISAPAADDSKLPKYLLAPISTKVKMVFAKPPNLENRPLWKVMVALRDVDIQLYEDQYRDLTNALVYIDIFVRWCRYRSACATPLRHAP
jgi:hypothetical protein